MSDSDSKRLAYEIHPTEPMALTVTDADGAKYRVIVRLAIMEVISTGRTQDKDGKRVPTFQFKAQLVAETDPVKDITEKLSP